jgi:O-acetyl-ADP-ribose deacetylase (regulator of RNase III)
MAILERRYKETIVAVIQGDITKVEADAIVNPANSRLVMGGGVAGAILRAGGRTIQEEAIKKAPVPIGNAVATKAGKLNAKYVIHTPTMEQPAMPTDRRKVGLATKAALECASQLSITVIAFPGMGTGVGGLGVKDAAEVMVKEIKCHIESGTSLRKVVLAGFNSDLTEAFANEVKRVIP